MNPKYKNRLLKFLDFYPLLPSLSNLDLLNKFWKAALRPNGTCEINKRGGSLIRETVAMSPRKRSL